jgi:hypothetical protein
MAKEIHFAEVTRNTDVEFGTTLRGAVFFKSETFTGGTEYAVPAEPCFPFAGNNKGFFFVPAVGDIIEIEVETDFIETPEPRYRCGVYSGGPNGDDIDELFKKNYPNRLGWVTKSGHFILFDDTDGEELLQIGSALAGTSLKFDFEGSWFEECVRNQIISIAKDHKIDIGGFQKVDIGKTRDVTVGGNETHTTNGTFKHKVTGDYILEVTGKFIPEVNNEESNPEAVDKQIKGGHNVDTGGGYSHSIGGSKGENIVSNSEKMVGGTESKMVGTSGDHVYGTGLTETVALGNRETTIPLGNNIISVLAGNIDMRTLAGETSIGNAIAGLSVDVVGGLKMVNVLGGVEVNPAGIASFTGSVIIFGTGASGILTFLNNPVIDNITGAPHIPSVKVFSD